jgi:hypothetical protein
MSNKQNKQMITLRISVVVCGIFALSYYLISATNASIVFYFTIQSNLLVLGYYLASFYHVYQSAKFNKIDWDYAPKWRGFITLMITVTGVVFAVILAPILSRLPAEDLGDFAVSPSLWKNLSSFMLHYYIPAAVIADWFFFAKKGQFSFKTTLSWFIYPLLYIIMVYVRAPFVENALTKYLYPFFNPEVMGIWLVPFTILLWLFFSGVAYLYVFLDNKLK